MRRRSDVAPDAIPDSPAPTDALLRSPDDVASSAMSDVVLDAGALTDLDGLLERLSHRDVTGLRVGNGWGDSTAAHAVVAATLMGNLRDRELTVRVADEAVNGFLRTGLASALARRNATTHFCTVDQQLDWARLGSFWTAATRSINEALFAADPTPGGAVNHRHATFVNAHLSSGTDGTPPIVYLVRRWLTRQLQERWDAAAIKPVVHAVGASLRELVANVQEHAAGKGVRSPDSIIRLSIDDDAVRCTVVDNGVGIARSLDRRTPKVELDETLLAELLKGTVQGWHQGRGIGLPKVAQLVEERQGSLFLATGSYRAEQHFGSASPITESGRFDVDGTAVDFAVPTSA